MGNCASSSSEQAVEPDPPLVLPENNPGNANNPIGLMPDDLRQLILSTMLEPQDLANFVRVDRQARFATVLTNKIIMVL